jgi:DinB superfamily
MSSKDAITSQYHAALEMLRQAVTRCPDSLWDDRRYKNVFWHIAYHTLHYADLYVQPSTDAFKPWAKYRTGYHRLDTPPGGEPYTKENILEYLDLCWQSVEKQVAAMDLDAPSGFGWLPFSKLELQIYNVRHIQQHTGELCERLGATGDIEVKWVGK